MISIKELCAVCRNQLTPHFEDLLQVRTAPRSGARDSLVCAALLFRWNLY